MIKVLHVIARLNVGGPAVQVVNIAKGLDPSRYEVVVLTGRVQQGEDPSAVAQGDELPIRTLPELGRSVRPADDARALAALRRELRSFRPDIVHTHTAKAGVLGRVASLSTGVGRRVHTFHGHLLHGYFNPLVTAGVVRAERVLARRTDRLVAVGERVRDDLLAARIGTPRQYAVHRPGVAIGEVPSRRDARVALGLPTDRVVVGFVGRMTPIKRPDRFLEAARSVHASHPSAVFVLAGGGPLLDELRASARRWGLPATFLGWRDDIEAVLAACDLVVQTSDNEGMPVSLIEAAMCGVPAVTTDVGSAREVVVHGSTGLVTAATAPAVAAAVGQLVGAADLRQRLGQAAMQRAVEHFSTATLIRETAMLYRQIVADHGDQG